MALLAVWEATSELGMTGGHLRALYATVLREAEPMLGLAVDPVRGELRPGGRALDAPLQGGDRR